MHPVQKHGVLCLSGIFAAAVFTARGHAAADVALGLVHFQNGLHLLIQRKIAVRQALGQILVHGGFGNAELLGGGSNGRLRFDDVHSQLTGSLLNVISHSLTP